MNNQNSKPLPDLYTSGQAMTLMNDTRRLKRPATRMRINYVFKTRGMTPVAIVDRSKLWTREQVDTVLEILIAQEQRTASIVNPQRERIT